MEGKRIKLQEVAFTNLAVVAMGSVDIISSIVNAATDDEFGAMRYGSTIPVICKSFKEAWEKAISDGKIKIDRAKMFETFDFMFRGWGRIVTFICCAVEEIDRAKKESADITLKTKRRSACITIEVHDKGPDEVVQIAFYFETKGFGLITLEGEKIVDTVKEYYTEHCSASSVKCRFQTDYVEMAWIGDPLRSNDPVAKGVYEKLRLRNSSWNLGLGLFE